MEPHIETLKRLLADKSMQVDPQWTDTMRHTYPFFTLPAALELERNHDTITPERRSMLTAEVAVASTSPEMLYRITRENPMPDTGFYPPEESSPAPSTNEAIATFIDNYGSDDIHEQEILEKLIFNPTPDYAQILAEEEERSLPDETEAEGDSSDSLINAFIIKSRKNHGHFPAAAEEPEPETAKPAEETQKEEIQAPVQQDDTLLSESLAKIYIKQQRYDKAFEIIKGLNLKYPEKSIYFADQLRFLQKLIINQQYKKQK